MRGAQIDFSSPPYTLTLPSSFRDASGMRRDPKGKVMDCLVRGEGILDFTQPQDDS